MIKATFAILQAGLILIKAVSISSLTWMQTFIPVFFIIGFYVVSFIWILILTAYKFQKHRKMVDDIRSGKTSSRWAQKLEEMQKESIKRAKNN